MACIERRPRCGSPTSTVVPEPLSEISSIIVLIGSIAGVAVLFKIIQIEGGAIILKFSEDFIIHIGGIAGGAALFGFMAYVGVLILMIWYVYRRCQSSDGLDECIAGAVNEVVSNFSTAVEELLPFTAMHDRVDVVVKSKFWDVVEDGYAHVYCTDEATPRRSEIFRCYYKSARVCNAGAGAVIGGAVAGVGGLVAGIAVAGAIGCSILILCLLVILLVIIIVVVSVLAGAFVGGQIAKAATDETPPSDARGNILVVGDYVTAKGNMLRTEYDDGANVYWWTDYTSLHGKVSTGLQPPFSYCDIDEEFDKDGC